MIGVSLPLSILYSKPEGHAQRLLFRGFNDADSFLGWLKSLGVSSVEPRAVSRGVSPERAKAAADAVHGAGLNMTIHAELYDAPAEEFFTTILPLFPARTERPICLTLHTLRDRGPENASCSQEILASWGRYALNNGINAQFALENNRFGKAEHEAVSCPDILRIVKEIDMANVGTCWDFGHLYSNHINFKERTPSMLPPQEFAGRALHTHIHAYQGRTHFPLINETELPLELYLRFLAKNGYGGVYNLEIEAERFYTLYDPQQALAGSIHRLKECVQLCAING